MVPTQLPRGPGQHTAQRLQDPQHRRVPWPGDICRYVGPNKHRLTAIGLRPGATVPTNTGLQPSGKLAKATVPTNACLQPEVCLWFLMVCYQ